MAWNPGVGRDKKGYQKSHPSHGGGGGNGGDGPPSVVHKPKGPTAAEIAAAKAKAEAEKRRLEAEAHRKHLTNFKKTQKSKIKKFEDLVKKKGYDSTIATDEETQLYDDWYTATGKKEKMTHPVLINSESIQDIREKDGKTKTFYTDKSSIEDLITGDINKNTYIETPELGSVHTYLTPETAKGPQSWAVNPGKTTTNIKEQKDKNVFEKWKDHATASEHMDLTGFGTHEKKGYNFAENFPGAVPGGVYTPTSFLGPMLAKTYQYGQELGKSILDGPGNYTLSEAWEEAGKQSDANIEGMLGEGFDKDKYAEWMEEQGYTAAKGGVARKKYVSGGILDITGDEQITTDEGNDISLVDESETGVSTLFMKKGGRVPLRYGGDTMGGPNDKSNDQGETESGSGFENTSPSSVSSNDDNQGSDHSHSRFDPGSGYYGEPTTTSTSGDNNTTYTDPIMTLPERKRKEDLKNMANNWEKEWGKWDNPLDKYSYTGAGVKNRANLIDKTYNEKRAELEKQFGKNLITKIALGFLGVPVSIGFKDVKAMKSMYDLEKQYKSDMQNLKDISVEQGWADFHHAVDTPMQTIEQLMSDTIKVRDKDDDTSDDGPEAPVVAPVTEEIQDSYAMVGDWMQGYRDLKAKQALSASLQEKWADERQWQQETMFANSGGLANLFRVKNQ